MSDEFQIRLATVADLSVLVQHRRFMFEDMGFRDEAALDAMDAGFRPWVVEHMQRGDYRTWLVIVDGEVVAGAGLLVMDWPPGPTDASCRLAFVYNVYTRPDYRRRGLARRLMAEVIDWCREQRIKTLHLHASGEGRALYESLGFQTTSEMRLWLDEQPSTPAGGRAHPR